MDKDERPVWNYPASGLTFRELLILAFVIAGASSNEAVAEADRVIGAMRVKPDRRLGIFRVKESQSERPQDAAGAG